MILLMPAKARKVTRKQKILLPLLKLWHRTFCRFWPSVCDRFTDYVIPNEAPQERQSVRLSPSEEDLLRAWIGMPPNPEILDEEEEQFPVDLPKN